MLRRYVNELATQPWFGEVESRLSRFLSYQENWNGYGEKRISRYAVRNALVILHQIGIGGPKPAVVPVHDGSVQIEWYYDGVEIEVEIPPHGFPSVCFARADGTTVEDVVQGLDGPIWDELHATITGLKAADLE